MKPPPDPRYQILIVDDNEAIHGDLKKILVPETHGADLADDEALLFGLTSSPEVAFAIDSAYQGQEGLACVEKAVAVQKPYALAFVDIRMPPGWDGVETISHLWEVDPNLQVVICTAYSDFNWKEIERRLGLSHHLVILKKPFDPIEVMQLAHALTAKWQSTHLAKEQMDRLDRLVEERTSELLTTVKQLEEARLQAELRALEDPLTKLANRRLFLRRLADSLRRSKTTPKHMCAVLFLDVDRFKIINDSLGHYAGDELLVEIASRLKICLRDGAGHVGSEDLIARFGGDEFAVLLDAVRNMENVIGVAERIKEGLSTPITLREREVCCTVSTGIVTSEGHYDSPEVMVRDADAAMYHAKENGGNGYAFYDESMYQANLNKLQKESEIRTALELHEFFLVYQPMVSLLSGEVEGFEALLRWQSPSRGLVRPSDFISLCEETGLIVPLGAWALEEACRQVARWRAKFGPEFRKTVSVNISARQFLQTDLVEMVERAMQAVDVKGSNIRLELTESVTMQDSRQAVFMLGKLQKLGVRLSVDDFGTGYSSLNYLHRFSVDTLKIDRSFVSNMMLDKRSLIIVRTIVTLAHNLHMNVIAEGVETAEQARLLMDMSCESAQGYYFSRPVRPAELEAKIEEIPAMVIKLRGPRKMLTA
jgi:diguanylate cyclase (GGDEF)-like protein